MSDNNNERREIETGIVDKIDEEIRQNPALVRDRVVVIDGEGWHQGVIGIVASRVKEAFGKPAIILTRDGENANAALLVTLHPEDFPGDGVFAGMEWQRAIEQAAFRYGGENYHAPAQLAGDFLAGVPSTGARSVQPSYRPGVKWGDLCAVLPEQITTVLREAIPALGRKLRGFDDSDAVLTAPETRSSSPVRIPRGEDYCSAAAEGLYPCGEGAGYAGGITSAAVDGIRCAEAILKTL
jgi:uncharacterized FAD-dependent dehydrogenase